MNEPQFSLSPSLVLRRTAHGNWVIDGPGYKDCGAGPRMSALADLLQEARELLEDALREFAFEMEPVTGDIRAFLAKTGAPDPAPVAGGLDQRSVELLARIEDKPAFFSTEINLTPLPGEIIPHFWYKSLEAEKMASTDPDDRIIANQEEVIQALVERFNALRAEVLRLRTRADAPYGNRGKP